MKAKGTLNPRAKGFIGLREQEHKHWEHQELITALAKERAEYFDPVEEEQSLAA
jgi:hypothetical protein